MRRSHRIGHGWDKKETACVCGGNQQKHASLRAWETVNSSVHSAKLNIFQV